MALALTAPGIATCGTYSDTAPKPTDAGATAPWRTYVNTRYRYRICYPAALMRPTAEADNGDGRRFIARDHGILTVYGRNNIDGTTLAKIVKDDAADLTGNRGRVSYSLLRRDWAVVSGNDGGSNLFYSKTIQRGNQLIIFELQYPKTAAAHYKPIVERISKCFMALS